MHMHMLPTDVTRNDGWRWKRNEGGKQAMMAVGDDATG
jgi:hypothetical protein